MLRLVSDESQESGVSSQEIEATKVNWHFGILAFWLTAHNSAPSL